MKRNDIHVRRLNKAFIGEHVKKFTELKFICVRRMIKSFKLPRDAFYYSIIDQFHLAPQKKSERLLIAKAVRSAI